MDADKSRTEWKSDPSTVRYHSILLEYDINEIKPVDSVYLSCKALINQSVESFFVIYTELVILFISLSFFFSELSNVKPISSTRFVNCEKKAVEIKILQLMKLTDFPPSFR